MRLLLALCLAVLAAGCRSLSPMDAALAEVRRTYPEARPSLDLQVSLGTFTRGLALSALAWGDPDDEDVQTVRTVVRTLRSAHVRRYRLDGLDSTTFAARRFRFAPAGWEPLVRVRSDGDRVWVMGRPSERGRPGMVLVGVLSSDELLLVQATGRYERLVEELAALQERERED